MPAPWTDTGDRWPDRLQLVAELIRPGSRVLDVGAGAEGLRPLLPASCTYTPVDKVKRSPATVVVDLNRGRLPAGYDCVVLCGVLEYVTDPARLFRLARAAAPRGVLTYAHHPREGRAEQGWVNSLNPGQLRRLANRVGWRLARAGRWEGQTLYLLGPQELRAHWCKGCGGGRNFGDQLTPVLLSLAGLRCVWAPVVQAELVGCGSILSKVPDGWAGKVLGTGLIRAGVSRDLSRAEVLAVRGALTRDACRLPASTPLGDLGLLVDRLLPRGSPRGVHPLGVLAHSVDRELAGRHPGGLQLSILSPPAELVAGIASCERLVTSTLHGLIAADTLGIPHTYEPHPAVIGDGFKFADYASSVGCPVTPGVERLSPRAAVAERQEQLAGLLGRL